MKNLKKPVICFYGTYDKTFTSNRLIKRGLEENGIKVVEVNYEIIMTDLNKKSDMGWHKMSWRILRKAGLITETIKRRKLIQESDVIYVGFPGHFDVIPAWITAKIFGKKLVFNPLVIFYTGFADDHNFIKKTSTMGTLIKWGEALIYSLCDIVFADTLEQKKHMHKLFGTPLNKIGVLPIGADDRVYKYEGIGNLRDKNFNVMYYGLFTPLHGTQTIIRAANILRNEKNIRFVMVGKGSTFEDTFELAQKLKLKNVEFYPDMTEKYSIDTLQRANVFLGFLAHHPSVDRIIPNKTYQGLALGKAVVCATGPAIKNTFKDRVNILLCKPSNPRDLADKILELKNNPKLEQRIAKVGYDLYVKNFTPKAVGQTIIKACQEIV